MNKKIVILIGLICSIVLQANNDDSLLQYVHLFPNCVDNEQSQVFGGTYGEYPRDLEDADFPGGGFVAMSQYIYRNTEMQPVYTGEMNTNGDSLLLTGIVKVEFVVDRCGKVGKIRVLESVSEMHDAEALRVIESFPIFKPAVLKGYRVKVAYIASIYFKKPVMPRKKQTYDYYDYYYW